MVVLGYVVDIIYPRHTVVDFLDQNFILADEAIVEDEGSLVFGVGDIVLRLLLLVSLFWRRAQLREVEDLEGVVFEVDRVLVSTGRQVWLILLD